MKKVKYLFLCFLMLCLCLVSCAKKQENNLNGQVKLNSISYEEIAVEKTPTKKGMSFKLDTTTTESDTLDYQYVVVDKTQEVITLVISLSNPKDYHIFDFTLTCDDENAKILINDEFELITEQKSINWLGSNNKEFKVKLQLTKNLEDTEINITNIYFSDRETGENVYSADLNNKGTFYVYKVIEQVELKLLDTEDGKLLYQMSDLDPRILNFKINVLDLENVKIGELTTEDIVDNQFWVISINFEITFNVKISDSFTYTAEKNEIHIDFWNSDEYANIRDKYLGYEY